MDTKLIVIVIVVLAIIFSIYQTRKNNQKKALMMQQLLNIEGFKPGQEWMGKDGKSGIAIDENKKTIVLIQYDGEDTVTGTFSYKDILASEILQDIEIVNKTSRKSREGRTKMNEIGFAGIGPDINKESWDILSDEVIRSVYLRITVDSLKHPLHEISFMNMEGKKQSASYIRAMKNAKHWHALLEALIKQADEDDSKSP